MSPTTSWNAESYARHARFVSDLGAPLLELLAPKPGERILDLGCGDGALTEKIVAAGAIVLGVDASRAQLQAARRRGLNVALMDGHRLAVKAQFDAVFSNAALHWMKQPELVLEGVAKSLNSGGRFTGEFGGQGNVDKIRIALHAALRRRDIDPWSVDPWYFPGTDEFARLLAECGFTLDSIALINCPTRLPGDLAAWIEVFAQPFTRSVPEEERASLIAEIRNTLEPSLRDAQGDWLADYVRLRFHATKCG
jgi:trans-aconitate methyltransferase